MVVFGSQLVAFTDHGHDGSLQFFGWGWRRQYTRRRHGVQNVANGLSGIRRRKIRRTDETTAASNVLVGNRDANEPTNHTFRRRTGSQYRVWSYAEGRSIYRRHCRRVYRAFQKVVPANTASPRWRQNELSLTGKHWPNGTGLLCARTDTRRSSTETAHGQRRMTYRNSDDYSLPRIEQNVPNKLR